MGNTVTVDHDTYQLKDRHITIDGEPCVYPYQPHETKATLRQVLAHNGIPDSGIKWGKLLFADEDPRHRIYKLDEIIDAGLQDGDRIELEY